MRELVDGIDATLATKSRDEWGEIFDAKGLIWGPVLCLHEVVDDEHANDIGMFPELNHPELGPYRTVNAPMRFATADVGPRGPAPTLGQHSREILTAAGLSDADIDTLIEKGAIA